MQAGPDIGFGSEGPRVDCLEVGLACRKFGSDSLTTVQNELLVAEPFSEPSARAARML